MKNNWPFVMGLLAFLCALIDVVLAMIAIPVFWIVGTDAAQRATDAGNVTLAVTISGLLAIAVVVCMEAFCQGVRTILSAMSGRP